MNNVLIFRLKLCYNINKEVFDLENKRTIRYKSRVKALNNKNNLLIGGAILVLVVLIITLSASGGKKPAVQPNFEVNQNKIVESLKDNSTAKTVGELTYYTAEDIKYLEGEKVDVKYYFYGDNKDISRIVYDVTNCDEEKVNKLIKSFDKSYKKIKSSKNTIENSTKLQVRWISDDTKVYYEKLTVKSNDKNKVLTKRITFIPIKK